LIEWLAPGFLYSLAKDGLGLLRGRRRRLSPAQVLELRQKWKPLFQEEIWKTHSQKLRKDAIIRDVKRLDNYPHVDAGKGISPWFRVGLMGVYHKGILVWLNAGRLCLHTDGAYRHPRRSDDEEGDIDAALIGKIPFERIEAVDWGGDEYYYFPHIYCHFDAKRREPYEEIVYCREVSDSVGRPHYIDIAPYESVRRLSKKLGIDTLF
jgi:hypothetical protein